MTFELLNVDEKIIKALKEDGIIKPTKIQQRAIPLIKEGKDVIGMSNTGSGKTAAFGIPILEKIRKDGGVQVLILTPTRELAVQISDELKKFSRYYHRFNIATVYGGVALDPQVHKMSKAQIIVSTTGRLLDHLRRGNIKLPELDCLILDEADKMVEMGFIEDIEQILQAVPNKRQILLFGATISDEINHLKKKHMNDPVFARADEYVQEDFLEQYYYDLHASEKFSMLVHLLKNEDTRRVMVFCSTRAAVETLAENIKSNGVKVAMLHGKLSQNKRLRIIKDFNEGRPKILVASAVAARGLDIRDVSHVINFSLSDDPQEYIHRVGRTARGGEKGKAITLLSSKDHDAFSNILRKYSDLKVTKLEKPQFEKLKYVINWGKDRNRSSGGHRGGRGSGSSYGGNRSSSRNDSRDNYRGQSRGTSRDNRSGNRSSRGSGSSYGGNRGSSRNDSRGGQWGQSRGPSRDSRNEGRSSRGSRDERRDSNRSRRDDNRGSRPSNASSNKPNFKKKKRSFNNSKFEKKTKSKGKVFN